MRQRGALAAVLMVTAVAAGTAWRWVMRLEVDGMSMAPSLLPGDRLLAVRLARWWPVRRGDLVVLADPRASAAHPSPRLLVKRVSGLDAHGVDVRGDNAEASTDARTFGTVPRAALLGRALYRYAPGERAGRLTGSPWPPGPAEGGRYASRHD